MISYRYDVFNVAFVAFQATMGFKAAVYAYDSGISNILPMETQVLL